MCIRNGLLIAALSMMAAGAAATGPDNFITAADTLPTLRSHLQTAKSLQAR